MKKTRLTNGPAKILRRRFGEGDAANVFSGLTLWERGTGIQSLKPKGNNCLASGDYSMATGQDANAYNDYFQSYAVKNNYKTDVAFMQKSEINLHFYNEKAGELYFVTSGLEDHVVIPDNTWWKGRVMAEIVNVDTNKIVSWSCSFTARNLAGTIVIINSVVTTEGDEHAGGYVLSFQSSGSKLRLKVVDNVGGKSYGIANIEFVEISKA